MVTWVTGWLRGGYVAVMEWLWGGYEVLKGWSLDDYEVVTVWLRCGYPMVRVWLRSKKQPGGPIAGPKAQQLEIWHRRHVCEFWTCAFQLPGVIICGDFPYIAVLVIVALRRYVCTTSTCNGRVRYKLRMRMCQAMTCAWQWFM